VRRRNSTINRLHGPFAFCTNKLCPFGEIVTDLNGRFWEHHIEPRRGRGMSKDCATRQDRARSESWVQEPRPRQGPRRRLLAHVNYFRAAATAKTAHPAKNSAAPSIRAMASWPPDDRCAFPFALPNPPWRERFHTERSEGGRIDGAGHCARGQIHPRTPSQ
jgi:hypothetical protein